MKYLCILLFSFSIISCGNEKKTEKEETTSEVQLPTTFGLNYSLSKNPVEATYNAILKRLQSNSNIDIVAQIDHADNAAKNGLELRDTRVILFGNPQLGTPILKQNPEAGLDLPQKILVFQDAEKNVIVSYNGIRYLNLRHSLGPVPTLPKIKNALHRIITAATNAEETKVKSSKSIINSKGIIRLRSANDFETTYNTLKVAILENPNLQLMAELDHQKNAAKINYELSPARLLIFGNPNLGTPLMQSAQTTAIDLPQKILIWEDKSGTVMISYNDPNYLRSRHSISGQDNEISKIANALQRLSQTASKRN